MDVPVDPVLELRTAQKRLGQLADQLDATEPGSAAQSAAFTQVSDAIQEVSRLRGDLARRLHELDIARYGPRTRAAAAVGVLAGVGVIAAIAFGQSSPLLLVLLVVPLGVALWLAARPLSLGRGQPGELYMIAIAAAVAGLGCVLVALLTAWALIPVIPAVLFTGFVTAEVLDLIPDTTDQQGATHG